MSRLTSIAALFIVVALVACSDSKAGNRDTMTKRQRDSVFGASAVPNAAAVTKAMKAADTLDAARKRMDSAMAQQDTIS